MAEDDGKLDKLRRAPQVTDLQKDIDFCQQQILADKTLQDMVLSNLE